VHVCSIVPISQTVGANRIVPSIAIPHPLGDPCRTTEEERGLRRKLLEGALAALETAVEETTIFDSSEEMTE